MWDFHIHRLQQGGGFSWMLPKNMKKELEHWALGNVFEDDDQTIVPYGMFHGMIT